MTHGDTGIPAIGSMIAIIKLLLFLQLSLLATRPLMAALPVSKSPDLTPALWNVAIYLSSEMPNLSEDEYKYKQIIEAAQKNTHLHLTVLFDPIHPEKNVHLTTVHRGKIVRHRELEKPINFGDGETLRNFFTDQLAPTDNPNQKVLYPATHYAFILSGDGGSDSSNLISVGYDSGSNLDSLTVYEIDDVLTEISSRLPRRGFDFIAFDACFMASFEVFYQLRHISKYIIAPESLTSSESFPYLTLEHFDTPPESVVKGIVRNAFDLRNFPLTQFVAIDLEEFSKISQPVKNITKELSILTKSEKINSTDLLSWRRDSLLYAVKKAAESINVDFNRWLFSVKKTASKSHSQNLLSNIDLIQKIFEKSAVKRGTSELRQIVLEINNLKENIEQADIKRWAETLKVDLNNTDLTTETFISVVVKGEPIPRRADLISNTLVFNMLKILKKLIHEETEIYYTDGLSIFFPDFISEEIPTTDFTKIKLEDRLKEFYRYQAPFYSGLDFAADTGWLSFLEAYAKWNHPLDDNEDENHDITGLKLVLICFHDFFPTR